MMKSVFMHLISDSIEIITSDEADEAIKELFDSLKNIYQNNLKSMKGSEFVFDYVYFIHFMLNVIKQIRIVVDHI